MNKNNRKWIIMLYTCIPSILLLIWHQSIKFPNDPIFASFLFFLLLVPICSFPFRGLTYELMSDEHPERLGILYIITLTILYGVIINGCITSKNNWKCYDKTSIDYNWQNDMKCINSNGEVKWTDYEGARKLMGK